MHFWVNSHVCMLICISFYYFSNIPLHWVFYCKSHTHTHNIFLITLSYSKIKYRENKWIKKHVSDLFLCYKCINNILLIFDIDLFKTIWCNEACTIYLISLIVKFRTLFYDDIHTYYIFFYVEKIWDFPVGL